MKKLISVFLAVIMMLTVMTPLAFANAVAGKYITIYVEGYGHSLYKNNVKSDENKIYPVEVDVAASVQEALMPCLKELANGMVTDNFDKYCDALYDAVAPIYEQLRLSPNGEAEDGSGWGGNMLTNGYSVSRNNAFSGGRITVQYDWRLSVEHNAEILEQFIDRVCREQKVEKVNLLGRCLGGNIVSAYLQNGKNLDKVNDVALYIPSTMGLSTIGAIFSGNIILDDDAVDTFVQYTVDNGELVSDPAMQSLITSLVSLFNYAKVLGVGTDTIEMIISKVRENLIPRLVRDTYGSFPSFWAMCPAEHLEEAVELCYGTDELKAEYAGTIEKIMSYYNNVQLNAYDTMLKLQNEGMRIMVVSKYNIPNLPLSADGNAQSDGLAETYRTSFGSVSPDYATTFSDSYVSAMSDADKLYLSADLKVDASKCLLRDTTWFIKNNTHAVFPNCVDVLINKFYTTDDFNVFSDPAYPQFLDYDSGAGTITAVTELDEQAPEKGSNEERFSIFIRFFTAIINFFKKLFSGEISFGNN